MLAQHPRLRLAAWRGIFGCLCRCILVVCFFAQPPFFAWLLWALDTCPALVLLPPLLLWRLRLLHVPQRCFAVWVKVITKNRETEQRHVRTQLVFAPRVRPKVNRGNKTQRPLARGRV